MPNTIKEYISSLARELEKALQIELPSNFERIFFRHVLYIGVENYVELGSLIMIECLEKKEQGEKIDEHELLRIIDRVRHRIVRQALHETPTNITPNIGREGNITPEKVVLLREELSGFLKSLSPLDIVLFEYFFLEEIEDKKKVLERLGISQATLYRKLREMKQAFLSYMGHN